MPPDFLLSLPPAGIFAVIFLATAALSLIILGAFQLSLVRRYSTALSEISPAVLTVTGAIFALAVTFLANAVWYSEDKAREAVYAEARSIRVMETYMEAMTPQVRDGLSRLIARYGEAVKAEWPTMAHNGGAPAAEHALRQIYAAVIAVFSDSEESRLVQRQLLDTLDSLSVARQERLTMAQDVVSAGQWILVIGLGTLLLVVFAMGHARFAMARRIVLGILTVLLSIVLFVIVLHHNPFAGPVAQTPDQILKAAQILGPEPPSTHQ
jgi:hypothetical protein